MMSSRVNFGSSWSPLVNLPRSRQHYALVSIGSDRVALVGGNDTSANSDLDVVDVFNLETQQWTSFRMREKRYGCAAVAIGECIYILGGFNRENGHLTSCETLDVSGDEMTQSKTLPSMKKPRTFASAIIYDKTKIVVLGGSSSGGGTKLCTVQIFDTISCTWTTRPSPMSVPRYGHVAAVASSQIIVAGGYGSSSSTSVEMLDIGTNHWKMVPSMKGSQVHAGGAVIGRSARSYHMVIAGQRNAEAFCLFTNEWFELPAFATSSVHRKLVVLDGKLVAGGDTMLETLDVSVDCGRLPRLLRLEDADEFVVELNRWAGKMGQLQELPFLYTIVRLLYALGILTSEEQNNIIIHCFKSCIPFCVSSEHLALCTVAFAKAEHDGIIDSVLGKSLVTKAAATRFQQNFVFGDEWTGFLEDSEATIQGEQTALNALEDLKLGLAAAHKSNNCFQKEAANAYSNICNSTLRKIVHLRSDLASIGESCNQCRNTLIKSGALVWNAIFRVFFNATQGQNSFYKDPLGTILTRIVDFGDADHISQMIGLLSSKHPHECEHLQASFEKGFGLDENLIGTEKDGDVMLLVGVLCKLISQAAVDVTSNDTPLDVNQRKSTLLPAVALRGDVSTEGVDRNPPSNDESNDNWAVASVQGCSGPKFAPTMKDEDCVHDLFAAVFHGDMESLTEVFEYNPNVDVSQEDSLGRTPADFAAIMGQPKMMDFLIQKGGQNKAMNRPTLRALGRKRALARKKARAQAAGY